MILARAPMRVSFFGGGSDIPSHYRKWGGSTLSTAIDKYVYVAVSHTPHDHIKVSYAKQEIVKDVRDIQNEIVRNALTYYNIDSNIEINSFADIPTMGTGLGGSSAFTCALVRALAEYRYGPNYNWCEYDTAEDACLIEIKLCNWNIGKQDQYASAFGGMNYIRYWPGGEGEYDNITVQRMDPNNIDQYMILIPTNTSRHAAEILDKINMYDKSTHIMELSKIADAYSYSKPYLQTYASALSESWNIKKRLQGSISNPQIDEMYDTCMNNGAIGCKLLGAGGGGYMLALTENRDQIHKVFSDRVCLDVKVANEGAKIVYKD